MQGCFSYQRLPETEEALRNIRELNTLAENEDGNRRANSDLIEQEIVAVLTHNRSTPKRITVQDAALMVANAIDNDMQTFNKALTSVETTLEMPMRHFFSQAILAYARQLSTNVEVQR